MSNALLLATKEMSYRLLSVCPKNTSRSSHVHRAKPMAECEFSPSARLLPLSRVMRGNGLNTLLPPPGCKFRFAT